MNTIASPNAIRPRRRRAAARWMLAVSALLLALSSVAGVMAQDAAGAGQKGPAPAVPAARKATNVAVIPIDAEINAVMAKSVERRIKQAEQEGADAFVIELDTPGGEVGAVLDICDAIKGSSISNSVAWVNPRAYSGGAIVALACSEIVVCDNATLGDALPVSGNILDWINGKGLPEAERQKVLVPLLTEVVDSARRNGYDEKLVQGIVSRGVELWLVENKQTGKRLFIGPEEYRLLFGQAPPKAETPAIPAAPQSSPVAGASSGGSNGTGGTDQDASQGGLLSGGSVEPDKKFVPASPTMTPGMVAQISESQERSSSRPKLTEKDQGKWRLVEYVSNGNGLVVLRTKQLLNYGLAVTRVNNLQQLQSFFGAQNVRVLPRSWSEKMVLFMINPIVRGVLIVVFLLGLFIEMTHPGTILPGSIAAGALLLVIVPPLLNDMASWWEIAAIVVGLLCIGLEIFVIPGFGVTGVIGLLLVFGGLVGTFVGSSGGLFPDSPQQQQNLLWGFVTVTLSLVTATVLMYFIAKNFGSLPLLGRLVLADGVASGNQEGLLAAMASHEQGPVALGQIGEAVTPLRPSGRVQFGDQILDACAELGFIASGTSVRVVAVEPMRITVEAAESAGADPAGDAPHEETQA